MAMSKVVERLNSRINQCNSLVCVGLDSGFDRLPETWQTKDQPQFSFNKWIIDQTAEFASAFKLNTAFYEARGAAGWQEMALTVQYLKANFPEIVTIADAKRADIGDTNQGYVTALLDEIGFDGITLHPYLGQEALQPFLSRPDKLCIVLCRTSNPGAAEFQDLQVAGADGQSQPLWAQVAMTVAEKWNQHQNCMLVVGATYPEEMAAIRQRVGEMPFLVPGVGAQGGEVKAVVEAGQNKTGTGVLINSSRGIILAENPREATQELQAAITSVGQS